MTSDNSATIGSGVISVLAGALSNADATKLPDLTIDSGGYFGLYEDVATSLRTRVFPLLTA